MPFVPTAAERLNILQSLYILADLAAQFSLDGIGFSESAHLLFFCRRKFRALLIERHACILEDLARARRAYTVNQRQGIGELFVIRNGDAGYSHNSNTQMFQSYANPAALSGAVFRG